MSLLVARYRRALLLGLLLIPLLASPRVYASPITVTVTPLSQVVAEYSTAPYHIDLSTPAAGILAGDQYSLSLSDLSGGSAAFSPSSVVTLGGALTGSADLLIDAGSVCPGTYTMQVSATHSGGPTYPAIPDSGTSAFFTLTITPVGPPLQATVSTDKPAYRLSDKITIFMNVNKPAFARLSITPPSGTPRVFNFILYGASSRSLTADTVGRWTVTLETSVCSEFSSAVAYFDVAPDTYDASISLSGVPSDVSVPVTVDGNPQGTISGSEIRKLSFKVDTQHSISVQQYVPGPTGVRYYCAQNTWNVGSAGSKTFEYETQYQLTISTDPTGITDVGAGGWYKAGSVAQSGQAPAELQGGAGTKYVFKGWKLDGALQSGNPISVNMDKPHDLVAAYETQYELTVDSQYGNPQGAGFYPAGSTATFSVTTPSGFLIQQVLTGWDGDFSGTDATGTIKMEAPHRVHANWVTSYLQLGILVAAIAAIAVIVLLLSRRRGRGPAEKKLVPGGGEQPPQEAPAGTETAGEAGVVECPSCHSMVPADQKFCTNCGKPLSEGESSA